MENKDRPIDGLIRRCIDKRIVTVGGACRLWIELDPGREEEHNAGPEHYCPECAPPWWTMCPTCGKPAVDHRNTCIECGARADA